MKKKIGIVIPSYNQAKYLEESIKSVLKNAENIDMDIAVIDGGSMDESIAIIEKYASNFIYWCSEPDEGQAQAINKGISKLKNCKYYLWLNSDDVFESDDAVKKIVEFAEKGKYDVCYGLSHFIDEKGTIIGEYPVEPFSYKNLGKRCYLSQPSVMFSREAYDKIGPLNNSLNMCLDYEYWMRLARHYDFGFFAEYIGATRIYKSTKTSTMQAEHLKSAIKIIMKYYGRVPMHWIVSKYLNDNPNSIMKKLPKRILMLILLSERRKIIEECLLEGENG